MVSVTSTKGVSGSGVVVVSEEEEEEEVEVEDASEVEVEGSSALEEEVVVLVVAVLAVESAVVSEAGVVAVVLAGGGGGSVEPLASVGGGSPQAASNASAARRRASTITSVARRRRARQDRRVRGVARWLVGLGLVGSAGGCGPSTSARAWPEADALLHRDAQWLGADAAYSVPLGDAHTLWMFGDTFVATSENHVRRESTMVRNTVAVQRGLDPVTASIAFAWGTAEGGGPASYLPDVGERWFWPLHGIARGGVLTTFWLEEAPGGGLGFEAVGVRAIRTVDVTNEEPSAWDWRDLQLPAVSFGARIGASVLAFDGHVYAYAVEEPGDHDVYLLRWSEQAFDTAELSEPEWWDGAWVPHASLDGAPAVVIEDAQTEFSVSLPEGSARFVLVQSEGFGGTTIGMRTAARPEGPWSERATVWRPPESDREGVLVYAAKAHPELEGEGLVITYASNATDFGTLVADETLYFPRFVRVGP